MPPARCASDLSVRAQLVMDIDDKQLTTSAS
jgi:hypothetical protein